MRPATIRTASNVLGWIIVGVLALMLVQLVMPVPGRVMTTNLESTCTDNMAALLTGLITYCQENGDRFPPPPMTGDWVARRWVPGNMWLLWHRIPVPKVAESGPLLPYVPVQAVWCPLDPGPAAEYARRGGYEWNLSLSGKALREAVGKPVLWPHGAWTRNGRWVGTIRISPGEAGYAQGAVMPWRQWVREVDFRQVLRNGKLPTYAPPARD